MAWDEWEQLKAETTRQASGGMQLASAGSGGGGGGRQGDLQVSQKDLAAVGNAAFSLFEDLGKYGRDAWSSSQTAAKDLKSQEYEIGDALHHVQARWEKQLQSLLDACAHISNHMDFTKKAHRGDEYHIASTLSSISQLNQGFDEGTQR